MKNCPVCDENKITKLRPYRGKSILFQSRDLFKCEICSLVFSSPMPNDEDLFEYNSKYFLNAHGGVPTHPVAIAFHSGINKIRVNFVMNKITELNVKVENVLEIGPGMGNFLEYFMSLNQSINYSIVESDVTNRERLNKKTFKSFSELKEVPNGVYDLIVISHVLEHTNEPKVFLSQLKEKLKINGMIFIEVPCEDYLFKDVEEPHLLFFNKNSMSSLLNLVGFKKYLLSYHGPSILKNKISEFFKMNYNRIVYKLNEIGINLPFSIFFPKLSKFLNNIEIAAIISFSAVNSKSEPSWWLRVIAVKN